MWRCRYGDRSNGVWADFCGFCGLCDHGDYLPRPGRRVLAGDECTVIDVGGQDTKVIRIQNGAVTDFLMNDKCSAGTGKFLEIMANRLGIALDELFELAAQGTALPISSLCTVFAESEVISYIGAGKAREDIGGRRC